MNFLLILVCGLIFFGMLVKFVMIDLICFIFICGLVDLLDFYGIVVLF